MLAVLLRFFDFYSALQFCWHYNFFSTFDIASQVSQAHSVSAALWGGSRGTPFAFAAQKIDFILIFFYPQQPVWIFNSDKLLIIAGILKLSKNPFYMKWYQIIRLWHYPFGTFLNNKVWSMNSNFRWSTFIAQVPFILGRWLNITILKSSRASQSALMAWVVWQRDIRSVNGFQCERCQWVSMGLRRSFHIFHIFL